MIDPRVLAQVEMAKFNQTILEMLSEFRKQILLEAQNGYIKEEDQRNLSIFTSILNTAGDTVGNDLLIRASNELEASVSPDWPYDFPSVIRIKKAFKIYRTAFRIAVGRDQRNWIKIMQDAAKSAYHSKLEDKMEDMYKMLRQAQELKSKIDNKQQQLPNQF